MGRVAKSGVQVASAAVAGLSSSARGMAATDARTRSCEDSPRGEFKKSGQLRPDRLTSNRFSSDSVPTEQVGRSTYRSSYLGPPPPSGVTQVMIW